MKCGTIQLDVALLFLIFANYVSYLQYDDLIKQENQQKQRRIEIYGGRNDEQRHLMLNDDNVKPEKPNWLDDPDEEISSFDSTFSKDTLWNHQQKNHSLSSAAVHLNSSSWIGNQWIPPRGYRWYTPNEFRSYFARHSILFVGDSTARRTYATLYAILNATTATTKTYDDGDDDEVSFWDLEDPAVIDINKKETTENCSKPGLSLCRHQPQRLQYSTAETAANDSFHSSMSANRYVDLMGGRCPSDIEALAKSSFQNKMNDYSLIVISMGIAELNDMCEIVSSSKKTKKKKPLRDYFAAVRELLSLSTSSSASLLSANVTIVWKTMGNIGWSDDQQGLISLHKAQYRNIRLVNRIRQHEQQQRQLQLLRNASDNDGQSFATEKENVGGSRVTVIDWGKVIEPRSYPFRDRIVGDIPPHYGLEARLVFLQMLMNHLLHQDM